MSWGNSDANGDVEGELEGIMGRIPRGVSESGFYHVIARGAGRQLLFEGASDRYAFLRTMRACCTSQAVRMIAWCLMENHVHLLLEDEQGNLSVVMHRVLTRYAQRFNRRSGHVGPVFQERFASHPVEDDAYLLEAVRYIHDNPVKAGLGSEASYQWSSYHEYVGVPEFADTELVLDMLGGREGFIAFSAQRTGLVYGVKPVRSASERELVQLASDLVGDVGLSAIKALPKGRRNALLRRMKEGRLSIRQIERLTGIGRNIIARA